MKKRVLAVVMCALMAGTAFTGFKDAGDDKELVLFTWEGMFPQEVLDDFEKETGVKVVYSNFDTDETMLEKLSMAKGGDYDIVIADDYILETAIQEGLAEKLDKDSLENIGNINSPAFVVVSLKGNYALGSETKSQAFIIGAKDISDFKLVLNDKRVTYTGSAITPDVSVIYDNGVDPVWTLVAGVDYDLELTDNTKPPCDQDSPEDVSLYILNNKDSCYDDTDQSQDNCDSNVVEGSLHALGCVISVNGKKLQQCGTADYDVGVL